jgi:hypothetical protein
MLPTLAPARLASIAIPAARADLTSRGLDQRSLDGGSRLPSFTTVELAFGDDTQRAVASVAVAAGLLLPILWVLSGSTSAGGNTTAPLSQAPTKDSQTTRSPLGGPWQAYLEPLAAISAAWSCLRAWWSTGRLLSTEYAPVPPPP